MPRIIVSRSLSLMPLAAAMASFGSAGASPPPTRASAALTSGRHGASAGPLLSIFRQIAAASSLRPSCSAATPR